ncbi:MAG TPA: hypothetical protein VFZ56_02715 [Gemmatimonadaceae bacterium]
MASLLALACTASPTERDINESLAEQLNSAHGPWSGISYPPETLTLDFMLAQQPGGQVSGSGSMRESANAAAVPITVQGTFARPRLTLSFAGMVYDGNAVTGAFAGDYTTAGGIVGPLQLTGDGYTKTITLLLQER